MGIETITTNFPFIGCGESRIGGRSENQDSYGFSDTNFGLLVTVCDGMGGGPAGKTASSIAVKQIVDSVLEADATEKPMEVLRKAILIANTAIIDAQMEKPKLKGMGTTCTVLLINEHSAVIAHVGDSRVYQLRGRRKVFRTFDHSMVFELVKKGIITEEQARLSENSNIITRALGLNPDIEIDMEERPFNKGDRFMLCTDGIHGTMPESELIRRVYNSQSLNQVVDGLADHVDQFGKLNGDGHDNLTVVIIETKTKSKLRENMPKRNKFIIIGLAVLLAFGSMMYIGHCSRNNDTPSITEETPSSD